VTEIQLRDLASPIDSRPEITFQMSRLTTQLTILEAEASAARTDRIPAAGWAPLAIDTGLTTAQEVFISGWSPDDVLRQCRAQRQMIHQLQTWLTTHHAETDLDHALTLLTTFSDALPDRPAPIPSD
jgi:hypothetical protein